MHIIGYVMLVAPVKANRVTCPFQIDELTSIYNVVNSLAFSIAYGHFIVIILAFVYRHHVTQRKIAGHTNNNSLIQSENQSYLEIPGSHLNINTVFPGVGLHIIKMRWSSDHLIFIMGICVLARWPLYFEMGPVSSICASVLSPPMIVLS